MKKFILLLMIAATNIAFAHSGDVAVIKKIVSGKVIDKTSGEELAGAEIRIDDKVIYTDLNGNFSASIDITKTAAVVKYISYNDTNVTIDPLSYNTITIELASK